MNMDLSQCPHCGVTQPNATVLCAIRNRHHHNFHPPPHRHFFFTFITPNGRAFHAHNHPSSRQDGVGQLARLSRRGHRQHRRGASEYQGRPRKLQKTQQNHIAIPSSHRTDAHSRLQAPDHRGKTTPVSLLNCPDEVIHYIIELLPGSTTKAAHTG
jgi:hypothetical protein